MHVVFGDEPVAIALAHALSDDGATTLASATPHDGPFLWRRVDLASGQGVRQAAEGAERVYVVLDRHTPSDGLFVVLRSADPRGALVVPLGSHTPRGRTQVPRMALVHLGPVWGPREPLVAAWLDAAARGRRLWVPDVGRMRPLAEADAVAGIRAAGEHTGVHWTLAGHSPATLSDLADEVGSFLDTKVRRVRTPPGWAAWRAGVDVARLARWANTPRTPTVADGWAPTSVGRRGWVDPSA